MLRTYASSPRSSRTTTSKDRSAYADLRSTEITADALGPREPPMPSAAVQRLQSGMLSHLGQLGCPSGRCAAATSPVEFVVARPAVHAREQWTRMRREVPPAGLQDACNTIYACSRYICSREPPDLCVACCDCTCGAFFDVAMLHARPHPLLPPCARHHRLPAHSNSLTLVFTRL